MTASTLTSVLDFFGVGGPAEGLMPFVVGVEVSAVGFRPLVVVGGLEVVVTSAFL